MFVSIIYFCIGLLQFVALLPFLMIARIFDLFSRTNVKPRLLWAGTTIVSLAMNAKALRDTGFVSDSIGLKSPNLKCPEGFTRVYTSTGSNNRLVRFVSGNLLGPFIFLTCLFQYDIFHFTFNGGLLNRTPLRNYEPLLLSLAGKKTIIFAYGSDAFSVSRIPYQKWKEILLADYPVLGDSDKKIGSRIDRFCKDANIIVGSLVHKVTLHRCDALMLTCYPVDTNFIKPRFPASEQKVLRIFHAPNHRTIKGSEYLISAVKQLQEDGFDVALDLVERKPHEEILERMSNCDLVVDQLHFGYALTAMEGMALGKMVISGKNPDEHDAPFQKLGLEECPIIWSSPDSIEMQLRDILNERETWKKTGIRSRAYVEKYHTYEKTAQNWMELYQSL